LGWTQKWSWWCVRHLEQDHQGSPFYLTSLESDAQKLGRAIRHWGIENKLHWTIDVTFAEDACRIRTGHAPQNHCYGALRSMHSIGKILSAQYSTEIEPSGNGK